MPRRGASGESNAPGTLVLTFQPPNAEPQFLFYKPPILGLSCFGNYTDLGRVKWSTAKINIFKYRNAFGPGQQVEARRALRHAGRNTIIKGDCIVVSEERLVIGQLKKGESLL